MGSSPFPTGIPLDTPSGELVCPTLIRSAVNFYRGSHFITTMFLKLHGWFPTVIQSHRINLAFPRVRVTGACVVRGQRILPASFIHETDNSTRGYIEIV